MTDLKDDVLRGVRAIADFTGEKPRRAFYLLEKGLLPGGQVGRIWYASKSRLRDHYAQIAARTSTSDTGESADAP